MGIQDDISCKIQYGGNAYDNHSSTKTQHASGVFAIPHLGSEDYNNFACDLMQKLIVEQLSVEGAFDRLERTNAYYAGLSNKAVIVGNGDNKLR